MMEIVTKVRLEANPSETAVIKDFADTVYRHCMNQVSDCNGCPLEGFKDDYLTEDCPAMLYGILDALNIR